MFGDAFWIYLFIKLNDIREFIDFLGFSGFWLCFVALVISGVLKMINWPPDLYNKIANLRREGNKDEAEQLECAYIAQVWGAAGRKMFIVCLIILAILGFKSALPTLNQAAAIYLGVQAKNSETVKTLGRLPNKYAKILEMSADKYVCQQARKIYGKNMPKDIKEMCNVKSSDNK